MQDFSITIVSYHNEQEVRKAVESIQKFTASFHTYTIYIVDNAGRTASLQELCDGFDSLVYLPMDENIGFGAANNKVLSLIDSKYHVLMNPDILLKEDTFSVLYDFMEKEAVGACTCRMETEDGNSLHNLRREVNRFDMFLRMFVKVGFSKRKAYHTMQDQDMSTVFQVPFAQGSFLLLKTSLFKELGGFDERFFLYMEDADLCKRINAKSQLLYCPDTTVIHKWEKGSHKNLHLFWLHVESMHKYFKKWK